MSILVLATFFAMLQVGASTTSCGIFDSHMGANFDVTQLTRQVGQPPYVVEDGDIPCTTAIEQNYTYYFNICQPIGSGIPSVCSTLPQVGTAGALQVDKRATADPNDDWCYVVGKYTTDTKFALLDQEDPTKGIQLTYYGDYCKSTNTPRTFNIQLTCSDNLNAIPQEALELSHCVYTVVIPSVYGCPLECPLASRKLCGGNGFCGYDTDKRGAKCFCNQGYSGSDCASVATTTSSLNYSPALLGLIITLFVIVGILVGSILVMIRQMATLKEDISHYQVLKSGEEDSTTV